MLQQARCLILFLASISFVLCLLCQAAYAEESDSSRASSSMIRQFLKSPVQSTKDVAGSIKRRILEFVHPIQELQPSITGLEKPLKELSEPISALRDPLDRLNTPVSGLSTPIGKLEQPLTRLETPLRDLRSPLVKVEESVSKIQGPMQNLGSKLDKLNPNLRGLDSSTRFLVNPLNRLHKSTEGLSDPIESLSEQVEVLGDDLNDVASIKELSIPVYRLEGQVERLAESVDRLNNTLCFILSAILLACVCCLILVFRNSRNERIPNYFDREKFGIHSDYAGKS